MLTWTMFKGLLKRIVTQCFAVKFVAEWQLKTAQESMAKLLNVTCHF
jgi:hypothetical protein